MTDPWSELDRYRADATRLAQPIPLADLRRRARRRRVGQISGVVGAVALVIGGVGVGIGYGASQRGAEPGPATQHTTLPNPTSSPSTSTTPTTSSTPPEQTQPPRQPTSAITVPQSSRHYDDIPPGYPWLSFVDDIGGSQGHIDGPDDHVRGPALAPCRQRTWEPTDPIRRLGIFSHFIEGGQFRQVLLFPSARAARRALDAVRTTYTQCPIQHFSHGWAERFVVTTSASHAALAVSKRAEQQGSPAPGLEELRWVRIANAVIYTWDTYDTVGNDPLPGRAADRLLTEMVSTWCDLAGGC